MDLLQIIRDFCEATGIAGFFAAGGWKNICMICIAVLLLYLAIFKDAEPYLLIPIGFGMLLVNLPGSDVYIKTVSEGVYNAESFAEYANISVAQAKDLFNTFGFDQNGYIQITELFDKMITTSFSKKMWSETALTWLQANNMADRSIADLFTLDEFEGLLAVIYIGVKKELYPCLIFLGIGTTTDFGPLIANPKSMILGAAAQIGIFITLLGAILFFGFNGPEAASIGIIGGADGPTAILTTSKLAPHLLSGISVAAYSYMALVPFIQPPIIRLLTTKRERRIKMSQLREVTQTEKIIFPILVTLVVVLLIPSCAPLVGMLMLGNLIRESRVVPKLTETAGNALLYIVTILLGICVGATASAENFLTVETIEIFALGIAAFSVATAAGVMFGKIMCKVTKGKVNPMIGAAGVSAVPMAARVVHKEGVKEDPTNFLLMHAMGPNVAGVIGSAIAAGILINFFG